MNPIKEAHDVSLLIDGVQEVIVLFIQKRHGHDKSRDCPLSPSI